MAFIYKMSCLEFTYFLIKNGYSSIVLTTSEQIEIEFIINNNLHRRLLFLCQKYLNYSQIKLNKKAKILYKKLEKYEHLIDL